jgi:colicin import membrane protein
MARKLKTYVTSIGFYDLAVAVPSMKAALEIWGADSNLFHQGFAKESDDADVVAATKAHPGTVLRRPVGTTGPFKETSELPSDLSSPTKRKPAKSVKPATQKKSKSKIDPKAAKKAALAFERDRRQREAERRKKDAAEAIQLKRRETAVAKAQQALEEAEKEHDTAVSAFQSEREKLDDRASAEDERWERRQEKLVAALKKAKSG